MSQTSVFLWGRLFSTFLISFTETQLLPHTDNRFVLKVFLWRAHGEPGTTIKHLCEGFCRVQAAKERFQTENAQGKRKRKKTLMCKNNHKALCNYSWSLCRIFCAELTWENLSIFPFKKLKHDDKQAEVSLIRPVVRTWNTDPVRWQNDGSYHAMEAMNITS